MSFGECLGSGPFFKAYVANLVPGQIGGMASTLDMYDRFLDPNSKDCLREAVDPPTGNPAGPAGERAGADLVPTALTRAPSGPPPKPDHAPAPASHNGGPVNIKSTHPAASDRHRLGSDVGRRFVSPSERSCGRRSKRTLMTAYFAEANGLFVGDEIRILGVAVGEVDNIEPQPAGSKVTFSVDKQYSIPADARAAILSPSLVTSRVVQLVPVYSGGPKLSPGHYRSR